LVVVVPPEPSTLAGVVVAKETRTEENMPDKRTIEKAREDKREGKSASTQAGEFVREEIEKIRHGEHGARSTKQAIAIGLSEARRAGVDLPPPKRGQTTERTRQSAEYAYEAGQGRRKTAKRPRVARAVKQALEREPRSTISPKALSRQARSAASGRSATQRSAAARKAVRTKGAAGRSAAAKKAARTRKRRS
jgi:Family of unknown function (DUF6496)